MNERMDATALSRRRFMSLVIQAIGGLIAAIVGIPIIGYILSPLLGMPQSTWNEVGSTGDFRVGQTVLTIFSALRKDGWVQKEERVPVYVRRAGETDFTVFSPRCTHLGCMVQWNGNAAEFLCPCHAGIFDADGKAIAGPPPRALDRYDVKVENGRLYVDARIQPKPDQV